MTPVRSAGGNGTDRPINVLQLVNAYGGGPGVVVYNLAKYLDRDRVNTTVCRLVTWNRPQEEAIHQRLLDLGIESINLEIDERMLAGALDVGVYLALRRLMVEKKIDVVHTHLIRADFFGRLAAWSLGIPGLVSTVHNVERYHVSWGPVSQLARWFEKRSVNRVGRVVCVSHAVQRALVEREGLDDSRLVTIQNGVDLEVFQRNGNWRGAVKAELGIEPGRPVVGTVGRFYPQKGLPYLIQAAMGILRKRPDVVFLMVGEGPMRHLIWRQIEVLKLADNFVLAGPRLDVRELLSAMDVFVLPSLWEGLPLAVLEAMAMELPCIVTNVGGNPEVVQNGKSGWVVPPRDPGILERRILELLEHEGLRVSMGHAGRKTVEERFDAREGAERYERLYFEVLGARGAAKGSRGGMARAASAAHQPGGRS